MSRINFPKIVKNNSGTIVLQYKLNYIYKTKKTLDGVQKFVDNEVVTNLMAYVSKKEGVQEKSIKLATVIGSGRVIINVPYATYQAYSPKIKKRVGKRGTYPFERMKSDKRDAILRGANAYVRRNMK